MNAGGYTAFRPLTSSDLQVFDTAFADIVGAKYIPYAVSTQIVNGVDYRFLCAKSIVTADPVKTIAIVTIHCAPDESVSRLDEENMLTKE